MVAAAATAQRDDSKREAVTTAAVTAAATAQRDDGKRSGSLNVTARAGTPTHDRISNPSVATELVAHVCSATAVAQDNGMTRTKRDAAVKAGAAVTAQLGGVERFRGSFQEQFFDEEGVFWGDEFCCVVCGHEDGVFVVDQHCSVCEELICWKCVAKGVTPNG